MPDELVNVRYMVDDVETAVDFYTTHFGFTVRSSHAPAFADVVRGNLRLLLSGPTSSAGPADARRPHPEPGGWNRIHFIVDDIAAEVERLRAAACRSATTSSAGRAASRSCSKIPPATRSSSSSPLAPEHWRFSSDSERSSTQCHPRRTFRPTCCCAARTPTATCP